jgi:hypothetical protein
MSQVEAPERIKVVIRRSSNDEWVGVAYCKGYTGDPSTIHEYVRADTLSQPNQQAAEQDREIIAALEAAAIRAAAERKD